METLRINKFNLPNTFRKPNVVIEIPFKYGYINFYPYSKEGEIILDLKRISKMKLFFISEKIIKKEAEKELDLLTDKDICHFIFNSKKQIAHQILNNEFEDLQNKLIKLVKDNNFKAGKIEIDENTYCSIISSVKSIQFNSPKFSLTFIPKNDSYEVMFSKNSKTELSYIEILDYKALIEQNLNKFQENILNK